MISKVFDQMDKRAVRDLRFIMIKINYSQLSEARRVELYCSCFVLQT